MPQLKRMFMVLAGLLTLQHLPAQTPVTMSDAIRYALQNSEVLKQARLDIEKGAYQVKETRANALPQLSATSTLTNNLLVQQFVLPAEAFGGKPGEFMAIKAGQTWGAMTQVQLSQQIFNQQVMTGLKAARTTEDFYRISEELARENVIQQVAVNYYQVQISRLQMSIVDANLERVTKLGDMIEGQYENGLAKKIDVDRVKVNKSNLEAQKLLLGNSIAQQENLLKYYMGMPVMEQITLSDPDLGAERLPEAASAAGDLLNVESLLAYSVLKKQEDLLKFQRDAIAAEAYPTLSLSGNYTYNTQSNRFNLYGNNALSYDMAAVTLNLRIPIFDGFSRKSRVRQSEIARLNLREDMRKTSNSLYMANENAKSQLDNSLRTIRTQAANKELAGEVYESIRNNYRNGLANLTDLLNAEDELVNAQKSYNEALLQYRIAEVELLKSNGKITSILD